MTFIEMLFKCIVTKKDTGIIYYIESIKIKKLLTNLKLNEFSEY